jgi:hypothetical protein
LIVDIPREIQKKSKRPLKLVVVFYSLSLSLSPFFYNADAFSRVNKKNFSYALVFFLSYANMFPSVERKREAVSF